MKSLLQLLRSAPEKTVMAVQTAVYGLLAGSGAVAFLLATNWVFQHALPAWADRPLPVFFLASFVIVVGSALVVGLLVRYFSPTAAGSGVPQLKAAYWKDLGFVRWREVWVRFLAGVISIGGGASLGREGPSVYIGGGLASNAAGWLGVPKHSRREATAIGAAAALAAAFNTPLAAVTFVLEEMLNDFANRALGRVVLGSVIGAMTVHALVGRQPAFTLPKVEAPCWLMYGVVPVVAAVAALLGVVFQRATLHERARWREARRLPAWLRPGLGALACWMVGAAVFAATRHLGVFGLGYQDLSQALADALDWRIAGLLVAGKLLATIACYSTGGSGGIFAPTLFLGGLSGLFLAGLASLWLPLHPSDRIVLAAVGMSACFGAVVRAPLTALLMVFEMTHQFELVPPLLLGLVISQPLARLAGPHNFYDALLLQDGHELLQIKPPRDLTAWQNLPVSAVANVHPVSLRADQPDEFRSVLQHHPYRCFPWLDAAGALQGVVTRPELETALKEHRSPRVEKTATCLPEQPIREVANRFLESNQGILIVLDPATAAVRGVLTLHDLLRAQASLAE